MYIINRLALSKSSIILYLIFFYMVEGKKCNFNIEVNQRLLKQGFHGNLSIEIDFASDIERERLLYEDCLVGIEQTLPSGVYSTMDEINDTNCTSLIKTVFKTQVNTEMPAEKSEEIIIHLLSKVTNYSTHIYIPVHARYHYPVTDGTSVRNEIVAPKLYLLCSDGKLDECENLYSDMTGVNNFCTEQLTKEECTWKEMPTIMITPPVTWDVPVGNKDHTTTVAWATALVVIVSSLYILASLHLYNLEHIKGGTDIKTD